MHTWHWKTWQDRSYLTCSLLDAFHHGFFTQQFSPQPPEELVSALDPEAPVYRLKQVHGNTVLSPSEIDAMAIEGAPSDENNVGLPQGDGLLTETPQQAIWVCTADCVPALIADVKTGQVAAVHAGWRGTAQEIVPQAIARLQQQGSQIEDLRVALGPAITGEVYQVSTQVAAEVGATVIKKEIPADVSPKQPESILEILSQIPDSPVLPDPQPGRARLDVRRINALQLEHLGLKEEQVAIAPYCTYQHTDLFFSYRRDRLKKVQWSGIVSLS